MNIPYITLVKEQKLNKDFSPAEDMATSIYISCDGIRAWLGYVDSIEEIYELINPNTISDLLQVTLSEEEYNAFEYLMLPGSTYTFYDEVFIVK